MNRFRFREVQAVRPGSIIAKKSGPCAVCTQEIKPQIDMICRTTGGHWVPIKDSGRHYMAAGWAHEGCVPAEGVGAPCLAFEQIDALLELVKTTVLPTDAEADQKIRRLTGALRTVRYNKHKHTKTDIAMALGPDLYEVYLMILNRAERKHQIGDWHQPRTREGQVWRDSPYNPDRPVPVETPAVALMPALRSLSRYEQMRRQGLLAEPIIDRFEDGSQMLWQVQGAKKWLVECEGYCAEFASVRTDPSQPYQLVEYYRLHETASDADEDIRRWQARLVAR